MGTELVAETSENLHILIRLSARENFIVVNFSTPHVSGNWCCYKMSPEIDHSRGDRRVLTSVCFDLTVVWLIAGEILLSLTVEADLNYTLTTGNVCLI
jgi:hypothetical protein